MLVVSAMPMSPEAIPPKPFKSATICGKSGILILRAAMIPVIAPNPKAEKARIRYFVYSPHKPIVTAAAIAAMAIRFPRYAFLGSDRLLTERMNSE